MSAQFVDCSHELRRATQEVDQVLGEELDLRGLERRDGPPTPPRHRLLFQLCPCTQGQRVRSVRSAKKCSTLVLGLSMIQGVDLATVERTHEAHA